MSTFDQYRIHTYLEDIVFNTDIQLKRSVGIFNDHLESIQIPPHGLNAASNLKLLYNHLRELLEMWIIKHKQETCSRIYNMWFQSQ